MILLKIGILLKNDVVVNHRSITKVILNPILRRFGYCIGSQFNGNKFVKYTIFKCPKTSKISYNLSTNDYDKIIFKNIL